MRSGFETLVGSHLIATLWGSVAIYLLQGVEATGSTRANAIGATMSQVETLVGSQFNEKEGTEMPIDTRPDALADSIRTVMKQMDV